MSRGNSTELNFNVTLEQLNNQKAKIYYGVDLFLGILILPGVIGNLHVLHIYIFKKPNNNSRVYICFLAVIDFIACSTCFPFYIINCLDPLTFYNDTACKIFNYLTSLVLYGSALTMLAISVERFRRICKPFQTQISLKQTKQLCLCILIVTGLLSFPVYFLYGSTEVSTANPNITGYECYVYKELQDTNFPTIYIGLIMFTSSALCTVLIIVYTLVGIRLWKQHAKIKKKRSQSGKHENGEPEIRVNQSKSPEMKSSQSDILEFPTVADGIHGGNEDEDGNNVTPKNNRFRFKIWISKTTKGNGHLWDKDSREEKFKQTMRTTYTFFLLALVYIISYVPFPILRLYQIYNMDWYNDLSFPGMVIFHWSLSVPFLNNVANPFIYMICDRSFRKECVAFYSKLFCRN